MATGDRNGMTGNEMRKLILEGNGNDRMKLFVVLSHTVVIDPKVYSTGCKYNMHYWRGVLYPYLLRNLHGIQYGCIQPVPDYFCLILLSDAKALHWYLPA